MFYSRPKLPQLNMDLIDPVDLCSDCPSQFEGRDQQGNEIYIRYRNGWLSVTRFAPGGRWNGQEEEIASHCIGPMFDGSIHLEQACDLLGITLDGVKPKVLTREEIASGSLHMGARDFSGLTTYWIGDFMLTRKSVEALLTELSATMPPITLLEAKYDGNARKAYFQERARLADLESYLAWIGIGGDRVGIKKLSGQHVEDGVLARTFEHVISIVAPWVGVGKRLTCKRSRPFEVEAMQAVGRKIDVCPGRFSQISTSFRTGDAFGENFLSVIAKCFASKVEHIDLATNRVLEPSNDRVVWYGNNMVRWCRAGPDRYLGGHRDVAVEGVIRAWRPSP